MKALGLLLSATALAAGWSVAVDAQALASAAPDAAPAGSVAAESSDADRDIVVTALRRKDNLMKTPIAAAVLTGTDLANKGVVNIDALQFAMPSVVVNNFGQGLEFNIRGIGKAEHNSQTTTGVITYRDGIPTFPGYFQEEPYFDIANVQVLRGPQGTTVGQNSTGGAVFVNTNDPIVGGGFHGYVNANYGNYNDAGTQGAINIPLSDTLAARVAFYGERRDSFYKVTGPGGAPYTGNKGRLGELAGRVSLLWKPTDQLSVLLKTDIDYLDLGAYPADPYTDRFQALPLGSGIANPNYRDLFDITANTPQGARDKFVRSVLRIDYDLDGGIKLRSITGFQAGNTAYTADLDGTAAASSIFFDSVSETQLSQEFNIISPDNQPITWLVGAFGLWNTYFFPSPYQFVVGTPANLPSTTYALQGRNPTNSLAAFGQVGYSITPKLKVDLGGRYTISRTSNHVDILQYGLYLRDDQRFSSKNFSYKASIGWEATSSQYLYAFAATGFRAGGLNVPVGLGIPDAFGPERVQSYEGGLKSNFAGGHIHTTIDAFYNDYKNFQVTIGYPAIPVFGIEVNVPNTTKLYGFEADAEIKFGGFSFDAGVNVLHSELGQFFATDPRIVALAACSPTAGPASASCINLNKKEQTYAPNFTFNMGAQYEFALGKDATLTPRVNFGHIAPQWATLFENSALGDRLGERNILTAQVAYTHKGLTVTAYGTNLTDQHYVAALQSNLDFAGPPRQYGIKVLKTF